MCLITRKYGIEEFAIYFMHEPCMIPETCMLHAWTTAYISCMDCVCFVHGIWPISCIFHVWYWCIPCMVWYGMVWYRWIPCMVQAYSMHVWCRRIPCVVQAYSMHGTEVFQVQVCVYCARCGYSHACTVQAYSKHIVSIHVLIVLAYCAFRKVQRQ